MQFKTIPSADPFKNVSFSDILTKQNKPGETSVLIRNYNGQPSKFIRISSPRGSSNVEVEYKEEAVNLHSRRR